MGYTKSVRYDTIHKESGGDSMANKTKKIPFAKLKGLRAERGLSMADMARICGISEGAYLAKENGSRDWKYTEMKVISTFFKESPETLFFN